jgi:hypothetical protein
MDKGHLYSGLKARLCQRDIMMPLAVAESLHRWNFLFYFHKSWLIMEL